MKKIHFFTIFLIMTSFAHAQFKKGFGFTTGAWGSGFHYMGDWELNETLFSGFEVKFIDVKNDGEMPAINYYTGQTLNVGDDALILFPLFGKVRYLPFEGMIANDFSPFVEVKAGANLALDGNGNARTFRGRWNNSTSYTSFGGQFVVGVIFPQINGTSIITSIGYETLPMSQKIDGRDNYDGMTLNISYIFRNRR